MGVNTIPVGEVADIYNYLGTVQVGKLIKLLGSSLTDGVGQILSFQGPHGEICGLYTKTAVEAALTGATDTIGTNFIPAGSMPLFITLYNTILITGASAYTAGDGVTADLFGTGLPLVVGDTANKWKTATSPKWYASAVDLTLTATTSNFTAGGVRAEMLYLSRGALLS